MLSSWIMNAKYDGKYPPWAFLPVWRWQNPEAEGVESQTLLGVPAAPADIHLCNIVTLPPCTHCSILLHRYLAEQSTKSVQFLKLQIQTLLGMAAANIPLCTLHCHTTPCIPRYLHLRRCKLCLLLSHNINDSIIQNTESIALGCCWFSLYLQLAKMTATLSHCPHTCTPLNTVVSAIQCAKKFTVFRWKLTLGLTQRQDCKFVCCFRG